MPGSYNKVNGDWSCENPFTLRGDLKQTLNYQGTLIILIILIILVVLIIL